MKFLLNKQILKSVIVTIAWLCGSDLALAQLQPGASTQTKATQQNGNSAGIDSANKAETVKSWTSENPPTAFDKSFLDSLTWEEHPVGDYVLRLGKIQNRWFAAMQFLHKGKAVLTEYTPPYEYITVVDPQDGSPWTSGTTRDVNHDGIPEIAFLHQKLNDVNYHMYSVYELRKTAPTLIWKSGGKFGDWLHEANQKMRGGALWTGSASSKE